MSKMCPECGACGGPDGVTNCATCRGDFWTKDAESHSADVGVRRSGPTENGESGCTVISIRPQLLCGKLSRELGAYIASDPGASPAEMLELCHQIFAEIGAVQVDGVWCLPNSGETKP